ncbi:MAG: hypothetical protein R8K46_01140 [Mariprofundaceae bacterium]
MSQQQLEAVVDFLAEAERKAVTTLEAEKGEAKKHLDALRKKLGQTAKQRLEALEKRLQRETAGSDEETARNIAVLEDETNTQIEAMRERHECVRDGLVAWAVKRITDNA